MPYARRGYGRRRRGARRGYRRRPYKKNNFQKAADMAYTAWRGVRYLKGLVNSELYTLDASVSSTINTTGTVTHITAIAQGDGEAARTGNSILAKSIYIKFQLSKHVSEESSRVRIALVRDNQQISDSPPTISDIWGSASMIHPLSPSTFGRFTLLYDKTFNLTQDKPIQNPRIFLKNLNTHVRYNGPANTDQQKNAFYLVQLSDEPTNSPSYSRFIRFRYHDN